MVKMLKKILCSLLVVVMCLTVEVINKCSLTASAAPITSYSQGDIIEFGWYPQSKVTDENIVSILNSAGGEWVSYNYYSGTGTWYDGKMNASDYMRYKDVIYNGNKYRGVVFDSYRPRYTGYTSSDTYQDDNGYNTNTVYWFLYEPIKWRVLDPETGMVMSEKILDSQAYNNYILESGTDEYGYIAYWGDSSKTYYANNYAESSIRGWLNNDFYNTAFSTLQQNIIKSTTIDNSAFSDSRSAYDSVTTDDKIYLLSHDDAINANYGFSNNRSEYDDVRIAQGSDYAKSQGLNVYTGSGYYGNSYWLLRSPGDDSYHVCGVYNRGCVDEFYYTGRTDDGIRPTLNFDLTCDIFQSDVKDTGKSESIEIHTHVYKSSITDAPTHLTEGVETFTCACGDSYTLPIEKTTEHTYTETVITEPTCAKPGIVSYKCECGYEYTDEIPTTENHNDSNYDGYCEVCNKFIADIENCDCVCHDKGIWGFIYRIFKALKIFLNADLLSKVLHIDWLCDCGIAHY